MLRLFEGTVPESGQALEIAPGIHWLRLPLPMQLDHVNVYALDDGDGWTIVDTGFDSRRGRAAWTAMLQGPLDGKRVRRVVATHHHADHMGLAGWFIAQGAELWTSRTAWLMARMQILDVQERPTPEALAFWRRAGMAPDILQAREAERPFNMADVSHPLPPGFTRLAEGDLLHAAGRAWRTRVGNGHAPEHLTFWSETDNIVIGGDQLLPSISPNLGVYPTEPLADTVGDWMESCRRFLPHATPEQLVLPGHGLPFTGLPTRLRALIENHEKALDRVMTALRQAPRSAAGCFDLLYRRPIRASEYGLALVEAVGHINHLAATGQVWQQGTTEDGAVLWGA